MSNGERDVLYRLSLDNQGVIRGLDQVIAKFNEMENVGRNVIASIGGSMKQLAADSRAFNQSVNTLVNATKQEAEATEKVSQARKKELTDKQHLAQLNRQVADATRAEMQAIIDAINAEAQARKRAVVERQLEARQMRQVQAELSKNSAELIRLLKLYPEVNNAIKRIVDQGGTFTATLGTQRKALNEQEQELRDLIALYPQLAQEIERLAQSTRLGQQQGITAQFTPTTFREQTTAASRAEAQQLRQVSAELARNQSELYRLIRLYPQVEHGIRRLIDQHGSFTFTLGGNRKALDDQEQEVRDLIAAYPQLAREVERITNLTRVGQQAGITLQGTPTRFRAEREAATLTPYDIRQVSFALEQLGLRGAGVAGQLLSVFGPVGLAVGAIGLAAKGALEAIVNLGEKAIEIFTEMIKSSVETAASIDSIEASFTGIFGSEVAGGEVVKQIREESERLGVELDEIVRKSLPFVRNIEDALKIGEFAVGLAQLDPKQGVKGATRVIQDALAGNLQPLRKTFAIDTGPIREAQKELGLVEGFLVGMEQVLVQRGLDFETLANTWQVASGQMQQIVRTLQAQLGEPILDSLIANFHDLFAIIQENKDGILTVANAIGQGVADVIDTVSSVAERVLGSLDEETAIDFADAISRIAVSIDALLDVFTRGDLGEPFKILISLLDVVGVKIQQNVEDLIILRAVADAIFTTVYSDLIAIGEAAQQFIAGDISGSLQTMYEAGTPLNDFLGNLNVELANAFLAITNLRKGVEETTAANREFADSVDDVNQAARDLLNAQLALEFDKAAAEQAQLDLEEFLEENKDITEDYIADREKAERDLGDKLEDATTKRNRDLLDLEEEASNKRLDAIRDNERAIDDIFRKNQQDLRDAALDLSDKEQDILRKNARKLQEIEKESTKDRIKIEEDFQEELAKLRRKYEFDKQEAIRKNDAIAFLELRRRHEFELKEAQISRDKEQAEEETAVEEKRLKAKQQLEEEIEDAKIANDRKLRDLQLRLDDELEAQRIKHQRELDDIATFEARKKEEIDKAFKRSVEDIRKTFDRRIRELEIGYEREIAVVRAKEAELTAILNQAKAQQSASIARYNQLVMSQGSISLSGRRGDRSGRRRPERAPENVPSLDPNVFLGSGGTSGLPNLAPGVPGRQHGGVARARQPILVGEPYRGKPNPEIIVPLTDSLVVPLRKMMFSPPRSGFPAHGQFSGGRASVSIDMVDPTKVSPEVRYQMLQMIQQVVAQAMTRARHG